MAERQDETAMQSPQEDQIESGSSSGSDEDSDEEVQVEWLATTREKRSTAGNRLTNLIQQEGEDDDLELLFAEDEDDAGFEEAGADDSDVQMDSSDDDDDQGPTAATDDLEGEKELERTEKAQRSKKRKANDHIPKIFRKKLKVDPLALTESPAPRPKKKSERASWLPTAEDAPTRASMRSTTKTQKDQLYRQMVDREKRRLKQLENMEQAAAKKQANKPKEVTQEDRLAEAARIEKKNARSLNRWEEAEKQREEEQRLKLAALHDRKMEGPVISWWSGIAEYVDGKIKTIGKNIVVEDKPLPQPRKKKNEEVRVGKTGNSETNSIQIDSALPASSAAPNPKKTLMPGSDDCVMVDAPAVPEIKQYHGPDGDVSGIGEAAAAPDPKPSPAHDGDVSVIIQAVEAAPVKEGPEVIATITTPVVGTAVEPKPFANEDSKPGSAQDTLALSATEVSVAAKPDKEAETVETSESGIALENMRADEEAPVPGPTLLDTNVLPASELPPSAPQTLPADDTAIQTTTSPAPTVSQTSDNPAFIPEIKAPPVIEHGMRSCIVLENFSEAAMKNKDVPYQVLFHRDANSFAKPARTYKPPPPAMCAITGNLARYRDPVTGIPYSSTKTYRELQNLRKGNYVWSSLLDAYVGEKVVARGVPPRFTSQAPPPSAVIQSAARPAPAS